MLNCLTIDNISQLQCIQITIRCQKSIEFCPDPLLTCGQLTSTLTYLTFHISIGALETMFRQALAGDLMSQPHQQVEYGRYLFLFDNRHLTQRLKIGVMIKTEFSALYFKIGKIRLFQKKLTDEQIGNVLTFNDDRRGAIGQAILTTVNREPFPLLHVAGQYCVAFQTTGQGFGMAPMKLHTDSLPAG